jgi:hypothetical protein
MIIAVDPGKTTGWARLNSYDSFDSGEQPLHSTIYFIHETLKKSRQTWSTEGIGALRYLTKVFDAEFVLQTPAAAKSFSTNDKLKKIGWYKPGKGHANDAARHLLLYGVGNGLVDVRQFME